MSSNPTTLTELVEALEAQVRSERDNAQCWRGDGEDEIAVCFDVRADLMERTAKVLRAVNGDAPCEFRINGMKCGQRQDNGAEDGGHFDDIEGYRHPYRGPKWLAETITRALGGSDGR